MAKGDWDNYEGRQSGIVWLSGIAVVILAFAIWFLVNHIANKEPVNDDPAFGNDPILVETTTTTTPSPGDTSGTTTTTELLSPEGAVWSPELLAKVYTVEKSGLQPSEYEAVVAAGTALLKAQTTNEGADHFADYINRSEGLTPMSELRIDYVWAEVTKSNPQYVKTTAWWGGKQTAGFAIVQATTSVYFDALTKMPVPIVDLPKTLQQDADLETVYYDG